MIRKSLNNSSDPILIIAGIDVRGSAANMLYYPNGIFIDNNFDLYVADHYNNRIQLFPIGQTDGIKVPIGVILDANKYLFVVDQNNLRIIGGSSAVLWRSMSFNMFGNTFAVDSQNDRRQKFALLTNSCT